LINAFDTQVKYTRATAFSADDRVLLSTAEGGTTLWDVETAALIGKFGFLFPLGIHGTFHPGGEAIALPRGNSIAIIGLPSGTTVAVLEGHQAPVLNISYNKNGRLLVSTSMDGSMRIWDATNYSLISVIRETWFGHDSLHAHPRFIGNSERILTLTLAESGPFYAIWHANAPSRSILLVGHAGSIRSAEFSPSGEFVATASNDGTARIWETAGARVLQVLVGHSGPVYDAKFSPDGTLVATASDDSSVKVWAVESAQLLATMTGHTNKPGYVAPIRAMSFSPDGGRLATASVDGTARIWDVKTGTELVKISSDIRVPAGVEFSPDAKTIIVQDSSVGEQPIFDSYAGTKIGQTGKRYPYDAQRRLSYSHGGERTASSSGFMNDNVPHNSAAIYDRKQKVVAILEGHTDSIMTVQYNADGSRLLTVSHDGTARLWLTFSSTQELIDRSIQAVPRCLLPEERRRLFLSSDVPQWCYEAPKVPFDLERMRPRPWSHKMGEFLKRSPNERD
jgi:WD40 repeat protein